MKILVACEESQIVALAFRAMGHEAYSCDIQSCSGGHPQFHIKANVFDVVPGGYIITEAGNKIFIDKWDMLIAFPPCTYLTVSGNRHIICNPERWQLRVDALRFVYDLMNAPIEKIAIENPVGVISTHIRKPNQIINPYYFGDNVPKKTCLWLKNLPLLKHSECNTLFESKTHVEPEFLVYNSKSKKSGKSKYSIFGKMGKGSGKLRSKTFPGIAKAMAEQWS
jgi:hypothetical protein